MFHLFKEKGDSDIPSISMAELVNLSEPFILDVREPEETARGTIPGVYKIPLGDLPERASELPRDATIYVVCRSGNRSLKACRYLKSEGFHCVNVAGGMMAYRGPLDRG
ncbi:MAG: rhodanese-like domain-containing protein [Peptoniphilus sp.]|nr:rhodanese-like domain-containing protein [Peptoniphilus sp.]MDD7362643.1 rhodanese-like domain-containing protein [Bacillota bacterium]MDY6044958.1 rhodanese-like domain-containing protein [Peptoniphilus sp.]